MVQFPQGKINIGLNVTGKRPDGFHNIESIFYPINWNDAIEIIPLNTSQAVDQLLLSGIPIPGENQENLCLRAIQLLRKKFNDLPPIQIHLHKAIPMGAGLGGGSSDAAAILHMINRQFNLQLSNADLISYALELGSDCPFFIINNPCIAKGRGELLDPIQLDLNFYKILLVNPGIHINTGWAFSKINPHTPSKNIQERIHTPIENWQDVLVNDFEIPVFAEYPEIAEIKEQLINNGAIYASMSGSGSTVFGIFPKDSSNTFNFPGNYLTKWV